MLDYLTSIIPGFCNSRVALDNKRCQGRIIAVTILTELPSYSKRNWLY